MKWYYIVALVIVLSAVYSIAISKLIKWGLE